MMRHAVRLNSLSEVALTKLDVLDTLDTVKVCVAYDIEGRPGRAPAVPPVRPAQGRADLRGAAGLGRRPVRGAPSVTTCRRTPVDYIAFLEQQVGVPISLVGVGPGREQFLHFAAA